MKRYGQPKLMATTGRASPKPSMTKPLRGLLPSLDTTKAIDMPNQTSRAPYKHETPQKGVISFGIAKDLLQ